MEMIKYGVEHITNKADKITMYSDKEKAQESAEKLAARLSSGESVTLFYAECDESGKLATNEFNILKVWN